MMDRGCSHIGNYVIFFLTHRRNFAAGGCHSWLWPRATTSLTSQERFFLARGHNDCLWSKDPEFTDDYIICEQSHINGGMTGFVVSIHYQNFAILFIHAN